MSKKNKYKGPYQPNPEKKFHDVKKRMSPKGVSPTKETFSDIDESHQISSEHDIPTQTNRYSRTELKRTILSYVKIAIYVLAGLFLSWLINLFYNQRVDINDNETNIENNTEKMNNNSEKIQNNTDKVNDLKTDKKLFEYRLEKLENSSVPFKR